MRSASCDGCVALVTGASRGIGAAIARRLAAEGADVAITARTVDSHPRLPGSLDDTARRIRGHGRRALVLQADLSDPSSPARLVRETQAQLGPIDVLVNNAAAAFYMPFERFSEKRFRVAFEVNVRAPFELAQRVLPTMRQRKRGWILNVSSATAIHSKGPPFHPFAREGGATLYGMTKAALDRLSSGLAAEVYGDGVAVNSLSPVAAVRTPGAEALGMIPEEAPELIEPVEVLIEAAVALVTGDPNRLTGRIAYSGPLLEELGRTARTLDGDPMP